MKPKSLNSNIWDVIKQIASKFQPEKIILFGSHAYGDPGEESDVDLLVIMDFDGSAREQATRILQAIDYHIPLDIIVRSRQEVLERKEAGDFFLRDVTEKGKVVYDRALS